jgi:proteic killer suppression protein
MRFRHANKTLQRMDEEPGFHSGISLGLVQAFEKRMHAIRQATNENTLRAVKSFRFERLKGKRKHEYSIRLNDQFRLIFQIEKEEGGNRLIILNIEDYH